MEDATARAVRRERLITRCAAQREAIAGAVRELEKPIAVVDQMLVAARFLRAHPVVLATTAAVFVALLRRNLLALAARGLAAWRIWRAVVALANAAEARWLRRRAGDRS